MVTRLECSVCFEDFDDFEHLPKKFEECNHTFCYICLEHWMIKKGKSTCPLCCVTINMEVEIPTDFEALELFEMKKSDPKCSCDESRTHYCPTCITQNYANWYELRETGEHTFCLGCACNHVHALDHKVMEVDMDQKDFMKNITCRDNDLEKSVEVAKQPGSKCKNIPIVIGIAAVGCIAVALAISFCFIFRTL